LHSAHLSIHRIFKNSKIKVPELTVKFYMVEKANIYKNSGIQFNKFEQNYKLHKKWIYCTF
jgi:hypothetical protein